MNSPPSALPVGVAKPASRQPMLWAAFAYAGGICMGHYAWRPPVWWLVAGLVFAVSAIYYLRRRARIGIALALSAVFVFGALTIQSGGPASDKIPDAAVGDGQEVVVTGPGLHCHCLPLRLESSF
jgi:hypothetical protein